jgi:hypothetical protein
MTEYDQICKPTTGTFLMIRKAEVEVGRKGRWCKEKKEAVPFSEGINVIQLLGDIDLTSLCMDQAISTLQGT